MERETKREQDERMKATTEGKDDGMPEIIVLCLMLVQFTERRLKNGKMCDITVVYRERSLDWKVDK